MMEDLPTVPRAYRAFQIGADDHVRAAFPIDAATDDEAIEAATQLVDRHPIELWERGRKVARFEPRREYFGYAHETETVSLILVVLQRTGQIRGKSFLAPTWLAEVTNAQLVGQSLREARIYFHK